MGLKVPALLKMPSLNLLFLRTCDQSCAGIRTPRIARDEPRSSSTGSGGCTHLLHCAVGKSSSVSSSTAGSAGWFHVSVLVISPPGIGVIIVTFPHRWDCVIGLPRCAVRRLRRRGLLAIAIMTSPLTIDLKAGLPKPYLLKRCDA